MSSDGMLSMGCPTSSLKKLGRAPLLSPRDTRMAAASAAFGEDTPCICGCPLSTRERLPVVSVGHMQSVIIVVEVVCVRGLLLKCLVSRNPIPALVRA